MNSSNPPIRIDRELQVLITAVNAMDTTLANLNIDLICNDEQSGGAPDPVVEQLITTMKNLSCAVKKNKRQSSTTNQQKTKTKEILPENILEDTRKLVLLQRERRRMDGTKVEETIQQLILRQQKRRAKKKLNGEKIEVRNLLDLPYDVLAKIFDSSRVVLSELCTDGRQASQSASPPNTIMGLLNEMLQNDIDIVMSYTNADGSFEQLTVENWVHAYHLPGGEPVFLPYLTYEKGDTTNYTQCVLDLIESKEKDTYNVTLVHDGLRSSYFSPTPKSPERYSKETFKKDEWVQFVLQFILKIFGKSIFEVLAIFEEKSPDDETIRTPEALEAHEKQMEKNRTKGDTYNQILNAALESLKCNFDNYTQPDVKYDFSTYTNATTIETKQSGGSDGGSVTYKGVTRKLYKTGRKTQVKFQKEWMSVAEFKKRINRLKK